MQAILCQLTALVHAGDRHLSYLPLAHIYERVNLIGVTHGGVSVGFYRHAPILCRNVDCYMYHSSASSR